jgi:hypothetical protein
MKSPFECRTYADECRALAGQMNEEHRQQTLDMAALWESLAREAEQQVLTEAIRSVPLRRRA